MKELTEVSIINAAIRCGIKVTGNKDRIEIPVKCPFCGDSKSHMSINTVKNVFRCNRCDEGGNAITLYAKLMGCTTKAAYNELTSRDTTTGQNYSNKTENEPRPLTERHIVYDALLEMLTLSEKHRDNLLERGLDLTAIKKNKYRTVPDKVNAEHIVEVLSKSYNLTHVPGFYTDSGKWHMIRSDGMFIPIKDESGLIQGLQMRLDNANSGNKYKWFSSRFRENGAKAYSWTHVANWSDYKTLFVTEGALKADVAAHLSGDCFIGVPGVSSTNILVPLLNRLNVKYVYEAFDMDKQSNKPVADAAERLQYKLADAGIVCISHEWDSQHNGIDNWLLFCSWLDEHNPAA